MKKLVVNQLYSILIILMKPLLSLGSSNILSLDFLSSEVFVLPLKHENFGLPSPGVKYRPSLLNMPDLPSWLHYTYSVAVHSGFLYGAPPSGISDIKLEVIATDKHTFNISRRVFDLKFNPQLSKPNEMKLKITNLNIDELLVGSRMEKLRSVLVDLWPDSAEDGAITLLSSATHRGDKLPMNPNDREGIYISYGSSAPFSFDLLQLQIEVKPLWHHRPCPKYFKKSSRERFFREKGFAIDWCNFQLQEETKPSVDNLKPKERNAAMISTFKQPPVALMKKSDILSRSYVFDVIYMILLPLLVMLALLGLLSLAMCCHRTNMDLHSSIFFDEIFNDLPKMPKSRDIQMVHYAGINKAAGIMRTVKLSKTDTVEHSHHPSSATTMTHVDTLPRSPAASPDSTLQLQAAPSRQYEDYATLTRPNPPPYQRNGSPPTRLV